MKQTLLKKTVLLTCLFILGFAASQAQWSRIRNIYGGTLANDAAVSFGIAGKGYVVAGSGTDQMYQYDTAANTWTLKGSIPADMGHAFGMSFVLNGKAYIVGGDTGGHPVAAVWMYDPAASGNAWTRKKDFPGGVRDAGFGFAVNNKGYVGAGFNGVGIFSDMWEYDASSDSWTSLDGIGTSVMFPASFVAGNKAYLLTGGVSPLGVDEIKKMWCFDPVSKTWSDKSDFMGAARQAAFAFSYNGYGYVGGGQSNYSDVYRDMWRYDPANNQWSQVQDAPLTGPAWSSAFVIGNSAYVGLGAAFTSTGLTGTDSFYKYDMNKATSVAHTGRQDAAWSVYPNPAVSTLHLRGNIPQVATAAIYDNSGRLIKEIGSLLGRQIDVSDLPGGVYTIRLCTEKEVSTRLFIKQ